jgi:prepilin-type N-terminal cleavage/methylation domain-containing protein
MRSVKQKSSQSGFSLLEMLVTIGIIMVVFGMAVFEVVPALRSAHMDAAGALVQTQLRAARAKAIADRGEVIVTFSPTGTIVTTAPNITGFTPVTVPLPPDVQFYVFTGLPNTPENFKPAGNVIDFDQNGAAGNSLKIRFEPNGSAIDDAGSLNNGAAYIAQTNNLNSQRAVTLLGATARVRTWRVVVKSGVATAWN